MNDSVDEARKILRNQELDNRALSYMPPMQTENKTCPACKEDNISAKYDNSFGNLNYKCNYCGYSWLVKPNLTPMQTEIDTMNKNIGALRQWLNEDRITDPKKMVTNEQIEHWLDHPDWVDSILKEFQNEYWNQFGNHLRDDEIEFVQDYLRSSLTRVVEEVIDEMGKVTQTQA